jgi:hypothetical protein
MNDQNPENPPIDPPAAPQGLITVADCANCCQCPSAIADDEQWDEIIELEIQLAPGNRISGTEHGGGSPGPQPGASLGGPGGAATEEASATRNNNNRRPRPTSRSPGQSDLIFVCWP